MAIEFEQNGEFEKSEEAFAAAVRHNKNANTLVNLGGETSDIGTLTHADCDRANVSVIN